jgi:hypothetical protein
VPRLWYDLGMDTEATKTEDEMNNSDLMDRYGYSICPNCNADMPNGHDCSEDEDTDEGRTGAPDDSMFQGSW